MDNKLEYIEKYTKSVATNPDLVVIWLHGLGANYDDFVPFVDMLKLDRNVKFIFPNAPMRPITINNGYVMRGWYDILEFNNRIDETTDFAGINDSVLKINQLIDQQISQGIDSKRIMIAGFSQGGVISYTVALSSKLELGGVIALSCYLPGIDNLLKNNSSNNKKIPIFIAHGLHDAIVPYAIGIAAYQVLESSGFNTIKWHDYPMEHSVCDQEVCDLSIWLNIRLALLLN